VRYLTTLFLVGLLLCACKMSEQELPFKDEYGTTIYYREHGICDRASVLDDSFMRSHHYPTGKMYGIVLEQGKLVPPVEKAVSVTKGIVWMCRYHIAEWIGIDPETGKRAVWRPRR